MQPIYTVCLDEIVRYPGRARLEEERNENMRALLNVLSKHGVKVLADVVNERLQEQGSAPFFESFICLCR